MQVVKVVNDPRSLHVVARRNPARPDKKAILDFKPARDGFGFANVFTWTNDDLEALTAELGPLLKGLGVGLPAVLGRAVGGRRGLLVGLTAGAALSFSTASDVLIRKMAQRWRTFGLCGGMALLAKERWKAATEGTTSELKRDAIRPILRLRQARTVRASWPRFLKYWLQAHAAEGVFSREELQAEAEKTQTEIDAGRLAILGLVGDTPDPFATHQVVAFGYEDGAGRTDFHVYDPNGPGRTRHVVVSEKDDRTVIETDLPTGPKKEGGYHISKTAGVLSMMFVVDA
ncbi:MAG: hypothetical protein IH855_07195 [Bacteroidetes bacterium]|nr:hypothetical protein [Bacteroidota bacterium]